MDIITEIEIFLLALGGSICFIVALLALLIEYRSNKRKRAIFTVEMATALLLIADMLAYIYDGNPSIMGYWVVRICNFLNFFLVYWEILGLNLFIGTYTKGEQSMLIHTRRITNILSYFGMGLIVLSQFTGWFYYFDDTNRYYRGPIFFISYIVPMTILILLFITIAKMADDLPWLILVSSLVFTVLPLISSVVQAFAYGLSLFNLSIGISAIIVFALALVDQNVYLRITAATEKNTGLPNAYGYLAEVEKICERKEITQYDAFYFDIVHMGLINRNFGNQIGDYVIKTYAQYIRKSMQKDEVLGRLGGNFFVAVVKRNHTYELLKLLEKVEISLKEMGIDETIAVSSVAGIYQITDENIRPQQIMANVSMAVSIAKNVKKKPYVFLTKELIEEMNEQRQLQEILPRAMENRELMPYYQPKVNLDNNTLCGAEALCRWKQGEEFISPEYFIPIIEQTDLICRLEFYLLHRVCEDIKKWLGKGVDVPVISINFSRKNLGNPILAEEIYNVVKSYDIPLKLVQIEITETIDEYPLEYLKGVVEALQRYGLSAAIDDFGVGSSSIRVLRDVPFDVLKIDKTFVDSLTEKDCKFLRHIIEMAKDIGADVIAEGAENKEQIMVLKDLGCHMVQGYYFDLPLSKEEFETRLQNRIYT